MSAASNAHTPGGRRGLTRRLSLVFLLAGTLLATAATPSEAFASSYAMTPGGLPVTVTTTVPDENATATFSGIAGKRISLRMTDVTIGPSTCCSAKVSILKPDGKVLVAAAFVGTNGGFIDTKTLPTTGTYTILVDPQKAATGSMTLTLYDVPADDVDTIAPGGAAVTATAAVPGQNATLTFAGTAGQRVSLLVGATCCSVQVSISRPNGSRLTSAFFGTAGGFVDTQTLPQAGTYTISVDPQGFATGDVTLTLYDVPPDVVGTITPGGPEVTATTTVPGQNAKLTFAGTKDQRVSLKVGPTCCVTRVSIVDPFGNTLVAPTFIGTFGGFIDTKTLTATGTYTIVIDPQNGATGATTFTLYDIPPDPSASITPGGPAVTVTTTVPGQNAKLTFSGTTGQRISLGVGPACCSTNISILSPDGSTLVTPKSISTAGGFVDPFTLPATGTYTIVVDPQGLAIGSTTFTLYDVAPDVTGTITAGGPDVTVTTTVPGQNAKLTFSGTTGQRI
ncbi:MAG: hypothetical protein M3265_10385, partial [Actinomycetota bacterium]|nr:hypothetical protein [Actinomycetota bacterium]